MKDKINLIALVIATLIAVAGAVAIAATHYALTAATNVTMLTFDTLRTLGWPDV